MQQEVFIFSIDTWLDWCSHPQTTFGDVLTLMAIFSAVSTISRYCPKLQITGLDIVHNVQPVQSKYKTS